MISGATGALAVVMVALVAQHGVEYLFATIILMWALQVFAGAMQSGKFIRLVPHPVMLRFVNGHAIVIFLAQMSQFKVPGPWSPPFHLPFGDGLELYGTMLAPFTLETFYIILSYAVILAAIDRIESLLTLNFVGEITGNGGGASQERIAQGVANTVTGFSAVWAVAVVVAVVVGVIVSALAYAWNNARRIHAKTYETPEGAKVYQVQGPLFLGASERFAELFNRETDPAVVIVDFADSRVVDQSAFQAIEAVAAKYEAAGKRIELRHLSHDCHKLLNKAVHLMVDSDADPDYELAVK